MIPVGPLLAVSPHLDDAALSAGAWIAEQTSNGTAVHVLTLFAGCPADNLLSSVALDFHDRCLLPHDGRSAHIRRSEDQEALAVLGAQAHHASFQDAIYRRRRNGTWLCTHDQAMFDTTLPAEPALRSQLELTVEALCRTLRPDRLVTCWGIGRHVDHLHTREAVLSVGRRHGLPIELWEDVPYALQLPVPPRPDADPFVRRATSTSWWSKYAALRRYRSQVRMLWPAEADWVELLTAHAITRGAGSPGELFWNLSARRAVSDERDRRTPRS
jgi:LmbE family N-acetylglucosaminyl deacetylase